jgi:hypothetical protein
MSGTYFASPKNKRQKYHITTRLINSRAYMKNPKFYIWKKKFIYEKNLTTLMIDDQSIEQSSKHLGFYYQDLSQLSIY